MKTPTNVKFPTLNFFPDMVHKKDPSVYTKEEVEQLVKKVVNELFSYVSSKEINGLEPLEDNWSTKWFESNKK